MFIKIFTKKQFFETLESKNLNIGLKRDKKISDKIIKRGEGVVFGFCQICKKPTFFYVNKEHSYNGHINFREWMVCKICKLNNRNRFLLNRVLMEAKHIKNCKIYIYEQVTSFYKKLQQIYPDIIGSEYLDPKYVSGTVINGIRHEDSTCLSFSNEIFDLVLSLDVFEHVFDLEKSFKEAYRILKPMGRIIFSIPFYSQSDTTSKRAELKDNSIIFLKEPQYHGNPISDKDSLVVYDISWDLFDILKQCGFYEVYMIGGYSRITGNIGSLQYFFEALKR